MLDTWRRVGAAPDMDTNGDRGGVDQAAVDAQQVAALAALQFDGRFAVEEGAEGLVVRESDIEAPVLEL